MIGSCGLEGLGWKIGRMEEWEKAIFHSSILPFLPFLLPITLDWSISRSEYRILSYSRRSRMASHFATAIVPPFWVHPVVSGLCR